MSPRRRPGPVEAETTFDFTIGDREVLLTARFTYTPGYPSTREEPGEGPTIEIDSLAWADDNAKPPRDFQLIGGPLFDFIADQDYVKEACLAAVDEDAA